MIAYINGDNEEELEVILPDGIWSLLIGTSNQTTSDLNNGKLILGPKKIFQKCRFLQKI